MAGVLELYPEAKMRLASDHTGFYYDFDLGKTEDGKRTFTPEDLEQIEKRMRRSLPASTPSSIARSAQTAQDLAISPTS